MSGAADDAADFPVDPGLQPDPKAVVHWSVRDGAHLGHLPH